MIVAEPTVSAQASRLVAVSHANSPTGGTRVFFVGWAGLGSVLCGYSRTPNVKSEIMASRPRDVVVVGASAGGVEALQAMVSGLPVRLLASMLVVLHVPADRSSNLPAILGRGGPLPARTARHGERLETGRIYTATPDYHLMVAMDHTVELSRGLSRHGHRPSIDVLFQSAAVACGARVTGVLLSGMLKDGVDGLLAISEMGGRTIVQDPAEAIFPSMPRAALRAMTPDHVVRAADIGPVLAGNQTPEPSETAGLPV